MNEDKILKCEIELDRIFFPKGKYQVESGEFAIFSANVIDKIENCEDLPNDWGKTTIKLKGKVCRLETYTTYTVICKLSERHEKYGDTYEILFINRKVDLSNKSKQVDFLEGIINPNIVYKLFEQYDDVIPLLEEKNIKALTKVKGIGNATALRIIQEYEDSKDYSHIYTELNGFKLTSNLIKKLLDYYKSPDIVIDIVKNNPYKLIEVSGIGFKKADEIAQNMGISGSDGRRVKACILHILLENGEIGRSYLHFSELMNILTNNLGFIEQSVINNVAKELIDNKEIYVSEDGEFIGIKKYYDLEANIYKELLRLKNSSREEPFEIDDWEQIVRDIEKEQKYDFTDEQFNTIKMSIENNILAITGGGGCVDCDTEYFNGYQWKKISEYQEGEKVLQFHEDNTSSLTLPKQYIKLKCDELWHFKTKYGVNQCLSDEHRVVYVDSKKPNKLLETTMIEMKKRHENSVSGFSGKFLTTFKYSGIGIDLTNEEIRVMCAVIADGNFNSNTNLCRINLKKQHKKDRLREILTKANISWKETNKNKEYKDYTVFYFYAPRREKYFSEYWYNCSQEQLEVIVDEVLKWDGSESNNRMSFSTTIKETADFVQFAFSACGKRAIIGEQDRVGKIHKQNGKETKYSYKSKEYWVTITNRNKVSIGGFHRDNINKTKIEKYKTKDGYKYCFTVDTGMLILRRNNRIFITGNSGKTSTSNAICKIYKNYNINACALSGKASVRITEATGLPASTIHRLLGYQNGQFSFDENNKLDTDVMLIDESTMINGDIFLSLLKALKDGTKLLMLGDFQQLTPIGNCQVFTDILNTDIIPISRLTKLHRQAQASGIIPASIKIANQQQIFKSNFDGNVILGELQDMELDIYKKDDKPSERVIKHFLKCYKESNNLIETQILAPMRTRGDLSTFNLNNKIQSIINPVKEKDNYIEIELEKEKVYKIKLGDKVINVKNNYQTTNLDGDKVAIFNGNIGIVKDIMYDFCIVDFIGIGEIILDKDDIKNLELAYAITIHKSQGSGFNTAIVAIESSAYVLLNAEMLYTGITRAKKYCVLIGQNSAIRTAIGKREVKNKQTYLYKFLKETI